MTNVHSDRNYVVKWTFATERKPVLIPIDHMPDSRDIFLQQYAHINASHAVAVYQHNVWIIHYFLLVEILLTLCLEIRPRMNCFSFRWMAQRNDWIQILLVQSLSLLPRPDSSQLSSITTLPGLSSDWTGLIQALRLRGKSGVIQNSRPSPLMISLLLKYVPLLAPYFSPILIAKKIEDVVPK